MRASERIVGHDSVSPCASTASDEGIRPAMKKLSGWQKAGVFAGVGCLSIIVVVVVGVIVAVAWARSTVANLGDPTPTQNERTIPLGQPPALQAEAAPTRSADVAQGSAPQRLSIDLADGRFVVRPGAPGGQVQVEGTYAPGLYELTEDHKPDEAGRASTTIRFRAKAPAWARLLAGMGNGSRSQPDVTVTIPAGVPIDLTLRVGQGASRIDLGGLMLKELGLTVSMGNQEVDFKEPVAPGLRNVRLTASMGNVSVDRLGNARARSIEASGSMGNLTADLGGDWQPGTEADLSFTHSMGELTVRAPTQVRLETVVSSSQGKAEDRSVDARQTNDPKSALLRLRVSTSMGESHISRY